MSINVDTLIYPIDINVTCLCHADVLLCMPCREAMIRLCPCLAARTLSGRCSPHWLPPGQAAASYSQPLQAAASRSKLLASRQQAAASHRQPEHVAALRLPRRHQGRTFRTPPTSISFYLFILHITSISVAQCFIPFIIMSFVCTHTWYPYPFIMIYPCIHFALALYRYLYLCLCRAFVPDYLLLCCGCAILRLAVCAAVLVFVLVNQVDGSLLRRWLCGCDRAEPSRRLRGDMPVHHSRGITPLWS
jgi:hypothetical protein